MIITDAAKSWPALSSWTDDYLLKVMGASVVTIDVTPNGYGDCVTPVSCGDGVVEEIFIKPEERRILFSEFLNILNDSRFDGVPYLSHQVC